MGEVKMGNPTGYRRGPRDMFSRGFKKSGVEHLSTYLKLYKIGDIVDVKGCGAFQKGMPHKSYHGKTLPKRTSVRIEHVKHSKCRKDFLDRVHSNEVKKKEAKTTGIEIAFKRFPVGPRPGHVVSTKDNEPQTIGAIPYEFIA